MPAPAIAAAPVALPPLSQDQADLLQRLTAELDDAGLWWLSGYAAGLARGQGQSIAATVPATAAVAAIKPATVLYGSQTGNAKRIAEKLARQLESAGVPARLLRADAYPVRELKDERQLYVVVSTQGEGDPPDDSLGFMEFLGGKRAPELPQLHFAVLGLGDSSYPQFCAIGQKIDERLAELGGTRLFDRGDADLDIETVSTPWLESAADAARKLQPASTPSATVTPLRPAAPAFDRDNPFAAEVLGHQRLTATGGLRHHSDRDIRHIELSLEGSGLHYEPGDALGVWPRNPPALVDEVLATLKLDGDAGVEHKGAARPLREWLVDKRELTRLSRPFLVRHAELTGNKALADVLLPGNNAALSALLGGQQLLDLLHAHPGAWSAEALVHALRPLTPRMYSIASSQKVVGDEAHLTVAHVEYTVDGQPRWGAASHYLSACPEDEKVPVFIEHNERFRLPADASRDVIMIGPGTGIAPFRGFVQERAAVGANGRNWLLFGNPHFRTDFLYQTEWQQALKDGHLHRLDLAFSRDQANKIYVQHRLREHGRELYAWLDGGAHLYVCGDATRMARDVHAALIDLIAEHGGHSHEDAQARLADLQQQGRYARDVY